MLRRFAVAAALAGLCSPAFAGEAADILRAHLYEGRLAAGIEELAPLQAAGDGEALFGTGLLTLARGIEGLAQAFYRHGLTVPSAGDFGPPLLVPVPTNPTPEPLDYQTLRAILEALVSDMDAARSVLEKAGKGGDYVVPLDLLRFRIDMDGDGVSGEGESIGSIIAAALGADAAAFVSEATPRAPRALERRREIERGGRPIEAPVPHVETGIPTEVVVGFDRADAIWLAGYSQVFAAQADFLLAHDFEETVNAVFHRLFPQAGLPMQEFSAGRGMLILDPESDNAIADLVAAIHTLNWPVVEPERLRGVLGRFQAITELSRQNWAAILAETDDFAELLPNPNQTSLVPGGEVTEEVVTAWLATLDTADQILRGELLVPHWRFRQGVDLRAYFETATRTDLVMMLTGYDALPFLRDGPIATAESFAAANRVFGDQLLGYMFWFN
jgi:hypothetical protein